jgi:hypothetical protein
MKAIIIIIKIKVFFNVVNNNFLILFQINNILQLMIMKYIRF